MITVSIQKRNNLFNFNRFRWLLKKALFERPVQTFGFTGLLLALTFILYVAAKTLAGFSAAQNLTFIWGLSGGSFFLSSCVFGYFTSNACGSSFLTLPASHFEKWLSALLIAAVAYPIIFLLFYRVIDSSFVQLYHDSLDTTGPFYKQQFESVYVFPFDGIIAWKVYPIFLFLTASMLLGALYFNKVVFVKVSICVCSLVMVIFGLNWLTGSIIFGKINDAGLFHQITIPAGQQEGTIELPADLRKLFYYTLAYLFPTILVLLSYTRLREKEF
jgi:hypothetical protein